MSLDQLMHFSQPSDRLLDILESIATPQSTLNKPAAGMTRWQTVRAENLESVWGNRQEAKEFFALLDKWDADLPLHREAKLLDSAIWPVLWGTQNWFYREGLTTGQRMATVPPTTRSAIAKAMAGLADPRWEANITFEPEDDLWELGAWQAAQTLYDAMPPAHLVTAIQQWNMLLETLERDLPAAAKDLEALRDSYVVCDQDLRRYFFHEGCLDGTALGMGLQREALS